MLLRFKYAGDRAAGHRLRRFLAATAPTIARSYDFVAPVPLHPTRLRERGYNQSAWLARGAASTLTTRLDTRTLVRVLHTPPQASALPGARAPMTGAFAARGRRATQCCVLLVDDVYTTGATASEAARALIDAGARSVDVAVLLLAGRDVFHE